MKVRATALGYAGKDGHALRQPGDVFEIDDAQAKQSLSRPGGTWFEPVEEPKKEEKKPQQQG